MCALDGWSSAFHHRYYRHVSIVSMIPCTGAASTACSMQMHVRTRGVELSTMEVHVRTRGVELTPWKCTCALEGWSSAPRTCAVEGWSSPLQPAHATCRGGTNSILTAQMWIYSRQRHRSLAPKPLYYYINIYYRSSTSA